MRHWLQIFIKIGVNGSKISPLLAITAPLDGNLYAYSDEILEPFDADRDEILEPLTFIGRKFWSH